MKRLFLALCCCAAITSAPANQWDCRALAEAQKIESKDQIMSYGSLGWVNIIAMGQLIEMAEKHYAQTLKTCSEESK